jgi:transposase
MLASLDPLGWTEATQVVEGNEADDPLYEPVIKAVRDILNREEVLYVGDCKMAAIATRAGIEHASDYYLMPLPATIVVSPEVLDTYLKPVWDQVQVLEPICRYNDFGSLVEIAEGFELTETVTGQTDDETISWSERRLIIRSIKYAEAQERALNKRLKKAKKAIADRSRSRSGYKCITTLDLFWPAVDDILKRYNVSGLLEIDAQESVIKRHRRRYRDKPARVEIQQVLDVQVIDNELALFTTVNRLGWRVYATNVTKEKLPER